MIQLPESLQKYQQQASLLLERRGVGEVEFSGSTFQVQIFDSQEGQEYWAFLQFDRRNRLSDSFCSCEAEGTEGGCLHLAAAYLKIFEKGGVPLHVRFYDSFWNRLCFSLSDTYGTDADLIQEEPERGYSFVSQHLVVFRASGLTPEAYEALERIFFRKIVETEATSLKFSNLSEEEIRQWRQGRPGMQLKYELSFWSDLAKKLMEYQDAGDTLDLLFSYGGEGWPQRVHIRCREGEFEFHLPTTCFPELIPALSTLGSPLKVFGKPEDLIAEASYDVSRKEITFSYCSSGPDADFGTMQGRKRIGEWCYIPQVGFFPAEPHPLVERARWEGKEISFLLDSYFPLLKSKLVRWPIADKTETLSYRLQFDAAWNLHISPYLFSYGDLQRESSGRFGSWVFLENKGFIPIEGAVFGVHEKQISESEVCEFVDQHRGWLNQQEGFRTHITGVESKLTYQVTPQDELLFERVPMMEGNGAPLRDFGAWVYIQGEGFYAKAPPPSETSIRSGLCFRRNQIPLLLRKEADELALIEGFFSTRTPLMRVGLNLEAASSGGIHIEPAYELKEEYRNRPVRFFEEYTFVEGEGFCRIPAHMALPERFAHSLEIEAPDVSRFITEDLEVIRRYAIQLDPRLAPVQSLQAVARRLCLGPEGYTLEIEYVSGQRAVRLADLWAAKKDKHHFLLSEVGLIDLEQERFLWLERVSDAQFDREANQVRLSTMELLRLNTFETLDAEQGEGLLRELREFQTPEEPDLSSLKSRLRPYQEIGLRWLWFLYHHRLSGLLCDDMGLGKTHQTMALIAAIQNKMRGHCLVVCPTSVLFHWEEKLKEFLPNIRVCLFHGSERSLEAFHADYDILLTSYGIWRKEQAVLSDVSFELAVFDEIQAAKNQSSRLHSSLLKVKARMRLGLTGTPIENRLRELKALFDLILPGYMPGDADFGKYFVGPIQRENNSARKELLSKFIKLFVLRRKKEDVLQDLPDKTEEIAHCSLSLEQKLLYNEVLLKVREGLYRDLQDSRHPIPILHVFSALSSLKQICNHPAAYLKTPEEYERYTSGKWDLFSELLTEALESGQKVVVFSQYLAMLDIFRLDLEKRGIGFATIRGATQKRGEEVRRFNTDPRCEVFIGSLHAAGLGIDLTAGSVVIHYDRWWNAAKENQATDRVHRIGQTRGVQVFKLVTKDSFEEKIDLMIARKGKLMEDVVGVDDYRFMKKFDREEIMQLFADVPL